MKLVNNNSPTHFSCCHSYTTPPPSADTQTHTHSAKPRSPTFPSPLSMGATNHGTQQPAFDWSNLQDWEDISISGARSVCVAKHFVLVEDVEGIVGQTGQNVNHEPWTKIISTNFFLKKNKNWLSKGKKLML